MTITFVLAQTAHAKSSVGTLEGLREWVGEYQAVNYGAGGGRSCSLYDSLVIAEAANTNEVQLTGCLATLCAALLTLIGPLAKKARQWISTAVSPRARR
jgi:hypothetical protein